MEFTSASVLNSVVSNSSTSLTANITSPDDADHRTLLIYIRIVGDVNYSLFSSPASNPDETVDIEITGLTQGELYEVMVISVDASSKQSPPSEVLARLVGTTTGSQRTFLNNLKDILSLCASFQTWAGAANQTEAKTFIHKRTNDTPSGKHAIIDLDVSDFERIDDSSNQTTANMSMVFIDTTASAFEENQEEAELSDFSDETGDIIAEMMQLQSINTNLIIEKISYNEKHEVDSRDYNSGELSMRVDYSVETGI